MITVEEFFKDYAIGVGALCIGCALFYFHKWYTMEYHNKKERPKKTDVVCPLNEKRVLRDFEVFNGHCVSCPKQNQKACRADIKKQNEQD